MWRGKIYGIGLNNKSLINRDQWRMSRSARSVYVIYTCYPLYMSLAAMSGNRNDPDQTELDFSKRELLLIVVLYIWWYILIVVPYGIFKKIYRRRQETYVMTNGNSKLILLHSLLSLEIGRYFEIRFAFYSRCHRFVQSY